MRDGERERKRGREGERESNSEAESSYYNQGQAGLDWTELVIEPSLLKLSSQKSLESLDAPSHSIYTICKVNTLIICRVNTLNCVLNNTLIIGQEFEKNLRKHF